MDTKEAILKKAMDIKVIHILDMDISLIMSTKEAILKTAMGIKVNIWFAIVIVKNMAMTIMDIREDLLMDTMDMEACLIMDIKEAH